MARSPLALAVAGLRMSAARWRRGIARATALAAVAGGLSGCCQSGWTNFIFRAECSDEFASFRIKIVAPDEPVIAGRPVRLRLELTALDPFPVAGSRSRTPTGISTATAGPTGT